MGAMIAQACHVSTALLHYAHQAEHRATVEYLARYNRPHMHKVILETKDESTLMAILRRLNVLRGEQERAGVAIEDSVVFQLWEEQPEFTKTCLAIAPNRREPEIREVLKGTQLWR